MVDPVIGSGRRDRGYGSENPSFKRIKQVVSAGIAGTFDWNYNYVFVSGCDKIYLFYQGMIVSGKIREERHKERPEERFYESNSDFQKNS